MILGSAPVSDRTGSSEAREIPVDVSTKTAVRGDAGFQYIDEDGNTNWIKLNYPLLMEVAGADRQRRTPSDSLDYTAREVYVTGTRSVKEIEADARLIDNHNEMMDFLEAAADGNALTYFKDLTTSGGHPCRLVNRDDAARLEPDRDRRGFGEYETRLRLRRIDGGDWDSVLNP